MWRSQQRFCGRGSVGKRKGGESAKAKKGKDSDSPISLRPLFSVGWTAGCFGKTAGASTTPLMNHTVYSIGSPEVYR